MSLVKEVQKDVLAILDVLEIKVPEVQLGHVVKKASAVLTVLLAPKVPKVRVVNKDQKVHLDIVNANMP